MEFSAPSGPIMDPTASCWLLRAGAETRALGRKESESRPRVSLCLGQFFKAPGWLWGVLHPLLPGPLVWQRCQEWDTYTRV